MIDTKITYVCLLYSAESLTSEGIQHLCSHASHESLVS